MYLLSIYQRIHPFNREFITILCKAHDVNDILAKQCKLTDLCLKYSCYGRNEFLQSSLAHCLKHWAGFSHNIPLGEAVLWWAQDSVTRDLRNQGILYDSDKFLMMGNHSTDFLLWPSASCRVACYFVSSLLLPYR